MISSKNEKNKIIKKWEKELTPPNYSNFMEFDQYQKKNAKFKKCYISQQDSSIFFHCRECCKVINGLYCVHCFNKSDHTDHHISVMYLDDAFCDCGDPKFIKRDCWCSLHINSVENTIYPNAEYHKLLKNKINEIFEYAIKNTGKESFSDSLQFILNISEWGSIYIDLISRILCSGTWKTSYYGQIFESYKTLSISNIEHFRRLLLKMVVSSIFKRGFISFLIDILKILRQVYFDENFPKSFLDIADFAFQCLLDGHLNIEMQKLQSFITELISLMNDVFTTPPFISEGKYVIPNTYCWDFHYLCSSILSSIINNPLTCRFLFSEKECLKVIAKLLRINSSNTRLIRETKEKVTTTEIHFNQLKNFLAIRSVYEYFAQNISIITVDFDEDIIFTDVLKCPVRPIDDSIVSTINNFFVIFSNELDKLINFEKKSNSFNSMSYFIQPYTEEFVIDHPLAKLFISCATCFSLFNSSNLCLIFDRIGFKKFDQLAAIFACCEASKSQIINNLFPMNDDFLMYMAIRLEHYTFFILSALQSIISIKSQMINESPGDIVIIIAETFGLPIWEEVFDPVDCQRWTGVMTSMLRLFINISCNDNIFNFLLDHEKVRNIIIDYIYSGKNSRIEIVDRINEFANDISFINEEFEKIVDIRSDNQGSHITLKPEFDDTSSVFSPYLFLDEYNKMISYEIKNHKGRLMRLKRFDPPEVLSGLKSYLQTDELKTVIHRILTTTLKSSDKFSISCSHTLFGLIRLILIESENPEETETKYIESDIINMLIQLVKKLENGILYLQNFIEECKPKYLKISEIIEKEIQEDIDKTKKTRPKMDKMKELLRQQYANQLKSFADKNEEELKTVENVSPNLFTCVICQEPFNSEKPYGILVNIYKTSLLNKIEATISDDSLDRFPPLCQMRICGHWSHQDCFENDSNFTIEEFLNGMGKKCPLDRTYSNAIIPAFNGDTPDEKWKEAFQKLSDQIMRVCDASAQQCLAYNISLIEVLSRTNPKFIDDKRNVLGIIHLLRACFFMEPSASIIEPADPFVCFTYEFCSGGDLKDARTKFDSMLPDFWKNLIMSVSIYEKDQQLLMAETYVRRISLLEQLTFNSDSDTFLLPTVSEFIESHHLTTIEEETKNVSVDADKVSFLSPCIPYTFPKLKENFTDYILNSKVIQENQHNKVEFCQCLLCGKMICIKRYIDQLQNQNLRIENLADHCLRCTQNTCLPILFLTGELATVVCIFDGDFSSELISSSIYTDKFGDENIGLKTGNMLFLNKYRVAKLFEDLVTGEIRRKLEDVIH